MFEIMQEKRYYYVSISVNYRLLALYKNGK